MILSDIEIRNMVIDFLRSGKLDPASKRPELSVPDDIPESWHEPNFVNIRNVFRVCLEMCREGVLSEGPMDGWSEEHFFRKGRNFPL